MSDAGGTDDHPHEQQPSAAPAWGQSPPTWGQSPPTWGQTPSPGGPAYPAPNAPPDAGHPAPGAYYPGQGGYHPGPGGSYPGGPPYQGWQSGPGGPPYQGWQSGPGGPPYQGWQSGPGPGYGAAETSGKAIAALVCSLVSVFFIPFLAAIAGLILAFMGRRDIRRSGGRLGGRGMTIAAIVISIVGIIGWTLIIVAIAVAASNADTTSYNYNYDYGSLHALITSRGRLL